MLLVVYLLLFYELMFCAFFSSVSYNLNAVSIFSFIAGFFSQSALVMLCISSHLYVSMWVQCLEEEEKITLKAISY